jgi:endonuclease YncB( thermonuclease family)
MVKKIARCSAVLCGLLLLSACAQPAVGDSRQVYQWVDSAGRQHFADKGTENATLISIDPGVAYIAVEKVFDGDTILLSDGQKVRFLGINTPEVAGRNKAEEVGGVEAKAWLQRQVQGKKVSLQGDVEKQDKYQRRLAYVFTEDKTHLNEALVRQGLAMVSIYPPNLKYLDALLAAQDAAEQAGLGIWSAPAYAPIPFTALTEDNDHGWKRLVGRIQAVKGSGKYRYLQFSDTAAIQVPQEYASYFPPLESYVGKTVEARGWVHRSKGRYSLLVRHPAEIRIKPH